MIDPRDALLVTNYINVFQTPDGKTHQNAPMWFRAVAEEQAKRMARDYPDVKRAYMIVVRLKNRD